MEPDLSKVWTRAEVCEALSTMLVDSLGVEPTAVRDDASLIHDLGAESIDFLDISFRAQQTFGIELPTRRVQEQILEWRSLEVLASVVAERHGITVPADELRAVTPSTVSAVFQYLREQHGLVAGEAEEVGLAEALAARLVSQMSTMGLDMSGIDTRGMAHELLDNLHSPKVMDEVLKRFTVGALTRYMCERLAAVSRLSDLA